MKTTLGRLFMPMLQPGLDCVLTSEELVPYETDQTVKEQDVQKRKEFSSESEDNLGCKRTKPLNENLLQDHGELALPPSCTPFTNTDDGALMSIPAVIEALRKVTLDSPEQPTVFWRSSTTLLVSTIYLRRYLALVRCS